MPSARLILQESAGKVEVLHHRVGQVVVEPAGAGVAFQSPLSDAEREDLRWYLESYLSAPYAVYEERGAAIAHRLGEWGERLFASVFGAGEARDAYQRALAEGACELWLSSTSPAFLGLPWELLRDPGRPTPLALELRGINRTIPSAAAPVRVAPGSGCGC